MPATLIGNIKGPQGNPGASSSVLDYKFSTLLVPPPQNTYVRLNNVDPVLATSIYIDKTTVVGGDASAALLLVQPEHQLYIQDADDANQRFSYDVVAEEIDGGTYVEIPIAWLKSGTITTTFANNQAVKLGIIYRGLTGPQGEPGLAATVDVGTTITGVPGTPAKVTNSGDQTAAIFDFEIPEGLKGDKGDKGDRGDQGVQGYDGSLVGTIQMWGTDVAPDGWLNCDGSAQSRVAYPDLFLLLGVKFGVGDGVNTFNLPDFRGRVPVGLGQGTGLTNRILGAIGGEETHLLTIAEMPIHRHNVSDPTHGHSVYDPTHAHSVSDPSHAHSVYSSGGVWGAQAGGGTVYPLLQWNNTDARYVSIGIYAAYTSVSIYSTATGITILDEGGDVAHNNMQPYLVANYIIKALYGDFVNGVPGPPGKAATIEAGSASLLPAGSLPTVSNTGNETHAVFDFGIPKGDQGDKGQDSTIPGPPGPPGSEEIGSIKGWPTLVAPNSWMLCDGSAVSRIMYPELYGVLGDTYGAGDGNTTFNIPDLRGRFLLGSGFGAGLTDRQIGVKGGEESHQLTVAELASHAHNINSYYSPGGVAFAAGPNYWGGTTTDYTGGNQPHNTMPPFLVLTYIIKVSASGGVTAEAPIADQTQDGLLRKVSGLATDFIDGTNNCRNLIASSGGISAFLSLSTAYNLTPIDSNKYIICVGGSWTLGLPIPTLGLNYKVRNDIDDKLAGLTGIITIKPASGTIDGKTTLDLLAGQEVQILTDGANWRTFGRQREVVLGEVRFNNNNGVFLLPLGYRYFKFTITELSASAETDVIACQVSADGGNTWYQAANYQFQIIYNNTATQVVTGFNNTTFWYLTVNGTANRVSMSEVIFHPGDSTVNYPTILETSSGYHHGYGPIIWTLGGFIGVLLGRINALNCYAPAGTIKSGLITVKGVC